MNGPATASIARRVSAPHPRTDRTRTRRVALGTVAVAMMTATAVLLLPLGAVTLFRVRRLYASIAKGLSRAILALYGVRVTVHGPAFPATQTVYVSNHTSTLDLFVLVALGLPNARFFLSGFLRKIVPLGVIAMIMGTFFTVPQDRAAERTRIFQRAARILRRTGESVYLSPEGERITTGEIGHFNKGAFHLAIDLGAPILPMYFRIPPDIDPGLGSDARPGTIAVHVLPAIDTSGWRVETVAAHAAGVRETFVQLHERFRCA